MLFERNKLYLIPLICFLTTFCVIAQTTYSLNGDWDDPSNWMPSYPGTTINSGDIVNITGNGNFPTSLTNFGEINILLGVEYYLLGGIIDNYGNIVIDGKTITFGTINNYSGEKIDISPTGEVELLPPGKIINSGAIRNAGLLIVFSVAGLDNFGTIFNFGSGNIWQVNNIRNYSTGIIGNSGYFTLITEDQPNPEFNLSLENFGTLTGVNIGHTQDFSNAGNLSPGNEHEYWNSDLGTYSFNMNYTHQSTATLTIELESSSSYDKVAVTNTAALDGILNVSLVNGFTPSIGDTFTFLNAGTVSGTFTTTNLPTGYIWYITYNATSVVLEVTNTLSVLDFEISQFKLYPNPTSNEFTIELGNSTTLKKVNIYNNIGQLVLSSLETKIKTSGLANGIYIVEITNAEGRKASKKLVID